MQHPLTSDPHYPKVVRYAAALQAGNPNDGAVLPLHKAWIRAVW
ncbi:MAG TPA: hypothetical protein QF626_09760 [Prochlorococcaceae cyanobacterium Fu_MAG_50]|nr:hypothetical protein [Prochlorococcaceae cyanobacterium Fu_MAG_50]